MLIEQASGGGDVKHPTVFAAELGLDPAPAPGKKLPTMQNMAQHRIIGYGIARAKGGAAKQRRSSLPDSLRSRIQEQ